VVFIESTAHMWCSYRYMLFNMALYYCTFTISSCFAQWQTGSTQDTKKDVEAELWSDDGNFIHEDLLLLPGNFLTAAREGLSSQLSERKTRHSPHFTLQVFFLPKWSMFSIKLKCFDGKFPRFLGFSDLVFWVWKGVKFWL